METKYVYREQQEMQTEYGGEPSEDAIGNERDVAKDGENARKRRTSFAMNVRSTIVEARYPARSVIVVMPRSLSSAAAVGQLCNDHERAFEPAPPLDDQRRIELA